jgi:hypothetical protein
MSGLKSLVGRRDVGRSKSPFEGKPLPARLPPTRRADDNARYLPLANALSRSARPSHLGQPELVTPLRKNAPNSPSNVT